MWPIGHAVGHGLGYVLISPSRLASTTVSQSASSEEKETNSWHNVSFLRRTRVTNVNSRRLLPPER